ncbi:MAG: hypothetical protein HC824_14900 [Synechococcales cyanobacterium RM1_1_8]|nr:hypothetical protein [Synechococcales cyanobacterium RM1_1_8]
MAEPAAPNGQPAVDYGPYKSIQPGMTLAAVQQRLGPSSGPSSPEGSGKIAFQGTARAANNGASGSETEPQTEPSPAQWQWTHPSGVYNIHVKLQAGAAAQATWTVQSKWLTYNPPPQ